MMRGLGASGPGATASWTRSSLTSGSEITGISPTTTAGTRAYLRYAVNATNRNAQVKLYMHSATDAVAAYVETNGELRGFVTKSGAGAANLFSSTQITLPIVPLGETQEIGIEWGLGSATLSYNGNRACDDVAYSVGDAEGMSVMSFSGNGTATSIRQGTRDRLQNVVLLGDSLTALAAYRQKLQALSTLDMIFQPSGVSGNTITDMTARVSSDVTAKCYAAAQNNIVLIWGGTNSLANGVSGAQALTDMQALINAIVAGTPAAKIVLINCLDRQGGLVPSQSNFNSARATFNAGLSGLTGTTGRVVDVASLTPSALDTAYFSNDKIHWIAAAYTLAVPVILRSLQAL